MYDNLIKLRGKCNITGRSVVIHKQREMIQGRGGLDKVGYITDANKYNESKIIMPEKEFLKVLSVGHKKIFFI